MVNLSKQLERSRDSLGSLRGSLPDSLRERFEILQGRHTVPETGQLSDQIDLLQQTRRLVEECLTGAHENETLMGELAQHGEASWDGRGALEVDPEKVRAVARQLFKSSMAQSGETVVITASVLGKSVVEEVIRLCNENDVDFEIDFQDNAREAILVKHLQGPNGEAAGVETTLEKLAALKLAIYHGKTKSIRVGMNADPRVKDLADPEKERIFRVLTKGINERFRSGAMHYILTYVPTPADAELDGMSYSDYLQLFFEACDQPWEEIKKAQAILKAKFDRAKTIHITNDDGTDVKLDITGQTFANSVVLKNLPGSELFSAPLKEGVNGKIVAKGKFQCQNSGVMENITLIFENGRVVEFDAEIGKEALAEIITRDDGRGEGTRYAGEIGIGTSPHLRRQSLNPLLVEKVGGSFHVALGSCYSYTEYAGEPVNLQNGNKSASGTHWDITTLLRGKNGKMTLDYGDGETEIVQDNGDWLVGGCDVLNQGWAALEKSKRPDWFKKDYPDGYQ